MTNDASGQGIRKILLEVVEEHAADTRSSLQSNSVLKEASQRIKATYGSVEDQALLTLFYDLFRNGLLSWGSNLNNTEPPFCHVTERGRATLRHLSRDPFNPDGYLEHLHNQGTLNPIARSYIQEALKTYNSDCFKASAVMTGAAAESLILELRDALINRITSLSRTPNRDLSDWRIKRVSDAIKRDLEIRRPTMPGVLAESFESYWPAFTQQIRAARNDAGHPSSTDPVTPETVHASLLIFPELVKLLTDLKGWVLHGYT